MTLPARRTLVRDLPQVGLRLRVDVPASWGELLLEGEALTVGGRLEEGTQTLPPTLQVQVVPGVSEPRPAAAAAEDLAEAVVLFQREDSRPGGGTDSVAELEFRSGLSGAYQREMIRVLHLPSKELQVTAVASCGSGAAPEVVDELRAVVASLAVGPRPPGA